MKNILIALFVILGLSFNSCDKGGEPEIGGVQLQEMCGEWYVELLADDGTGNLVDIYGIGYNLITTFNTAENNSTTLWLSDDGHIWDFKIKVNAELSGKTFSANALSVVPDYEINVQVMNGKITDDGAVTSGGNTSDLISFEIIFEDDPTTTYTMRGYKRTGFLEDEH